VDAEPKINPGNKPLFAWIGLICLMLIIPVKAMRFIHGPTADTLFFGIAPSMFGPAGLFFIIVSGSGRLARLTMVQAAIITAAVALGVEFAQLLPRPGLLRYVHYTFDWFDVLTSLLSVVVSYLLAFAVEKRRVSS
jgi:hypothetical protein